MSSTHTLVDGPDTHQLISALWGPKINQPIKGFFRTEHSDSDQLEVDVSGMERIPDGSHGLHVLLIRGFCYTARRQYSAFYNPDSKKGTIIIK